MTSERLAGARALAERIHSGQVEKGTQRPYTDHLVRVEETVRAFSGTEDQRIAAFLHDAVEDGGRRWWTEIERFGVLVTAIVTACTDSQPEHPGDKDAWLGRKRRHIDRLRHRTIEKPGLVTLPGWPEQVPEAAYVVVAADKLDGVDRLIAALAQDRDDTLWRLFKGGRNGTVWYYTSMAEIVSLHLPVHPLAERLSVRTSELVSLAGLEGIRLEDLLNAALSAEWPVGIRSDET